jgi:uncharacterized integral membrane protein
MRSTGPERHPTGDGVSDGPADIPRDDPRVVTEPNDVGRSGRAATAGGSGWTAGPAASTPAASTPAESTPAASTPAESTPAESTPAESTPATSDPADTAPTDVRPGTGPAGRPLPTSAGITRRTRISGTWVAVIVAAIVLVFLLVFILQNPAGATVRFLGFYGTLPLGVALLFATIAGALLVALAGTARILQLRRRVKRSGRY